MGWIASFAVALLFLVPTWGESLQKISDEIATLSKLDRKIAYLAEKISDHLNRALSLNADLKKLYALCLVAKDPASLADIQLQARAIAIEQDRLMQSARASLRDMNVNFETTNAMPLRIGEAPCELPAQLVCSDPIVFSFLSKKNPGGAEAHQYFCQRVMWKYKDPRVRAL